MMRPSGSTGAKIADRAPMTMRARPWRILCHSSCRSPALKMRMQNRHERLQFAGTEPRLEPLDRLRRQRNFRHEHNRAFALLQRVREGLQINFRFAGAGDAVQQKGCEVGGLAAGWMALTRPSSCAALHRRFDFFQRGSLRRIQRRSAASAKCVSRAYGSRSEISEVISTRPRSSSLRTVAAVVSASSSSSASGISRRSSMMFQTSCWRFGSFGNSPVTGSARTNNRFAPACVFFAHGFGQNGFQARSPARSNNIRQSSARVSKLSASPGFARR